MTTIVWTLLSAALFLWTVIALLRRNSRLRPSAVAIAAALGVLVGLGVALATAFFETRGQFCREIGCGFLLMAVLVQWFYWAAGTALAAFAAQWFLAGKPE